MVRSIGIDPGDDAVKVVELDGSWRKARLLRAQIAAAPPPGGDPAARADAIAEAAEAAVATGMRGSVTLGHPCREAVLRTIELPFKGHDAIRKVVKAEVEGEIHSHVVDDMVVDFHEIGSGAEGGTRVLVGSVPKEGLRLLLGALHGNGIEAETVDLDTLALWRAATWAGAFERDDEGDGKGEGESPAAALPISAVVDLGARSVKVLLVEGEQLIDMRALRLGDAAIADEIARKTGLPLQRAREAVRACLAAGTDQTVEIEEALPVPAGGQVADGEPVPTKLRRIVVQATEVQAAHSAFLQRLARELTRYLTASGKAARITAVWTTGGGSIGGAVREKLTEVFGQEPRELDLLGKLQHDLEPEQVVELGPRLAVAIGLALGEFGGPAGFQLRQEDLVLTRGFERIKFPLAIACLVGWLALFMQGNSRSIELKNLELRLGSTYTKGQTSKDLVFHGQVFEVFSSKWFEDTAHFSIESKGKKYVYADLAKEVADTPVPKRLPLIVQRLKTVAEQKQKESGIYEDVKIESGLAVLVRWSELLKSVHEQLGRYLVMKVALNMKPGSRHLEFTIAFRGDDFRDRWTALSNAIDAELAKPDSPFERAKAARENNPEERFRDSEESGVRGAYYRVTLNLKDPFEPFGGSRPAGGGQ